MRISKDKVSFIIVGLGGRGSVYLSSLEENFKNDFELVAVCEPNPEKQNNILLKYPNALIFDGDSDVFELERMADVAVISTQDRKHKDSAIALLKKGYDIILEKPISTNLEEVIEIYREAQKYPNQIVAVCHVLRDTVFFNAVKEIIASKELGEVVSIQHNENIGYYHYAHSYVRGSWNNSETSAPLTVTKCCHDMDIMLYLLGDKKCEKLSSFGDLSFFKNENYNKETMAKYCSDCKIEKSCPYSAIAIYSSDKIKSAVFDKSSLENIKKELAVSPYGRCVFACDNNVCDHQSSILQFEGGITATFNISAFTAKVNRSLKVMCEYGEIRAIEKPYIVETTNFLTGEVKTVDLQISERGHGGGDKNFVKKFMKSYMNGEGFSTAIEKSVESHVMSFLAEESRINGGKVQNVAEYMKGLKG